MYEKLLLYLEHPELSRFDGIYLFWIFIHVYLPSVRYHSHKHEKNMTQKWYHKVLWPFFSWLDAKKPTNPSTILIKNDKVTRRMNIQNRQMVIHTPKQTENIYFLLFSHFSEIFNEPSVYCFVVVQSLYYHLLLRIVTSKTILGESRWCEQTVSFEFVGRIFLYRN